MFDNPKGGLGYAAEFQSSALPWVTSSVAPAAGSPQRWDLPKVSRFITVSNQGTGNLSLGFTRLGTIGSNKVLVPANTVVTFELRVKEFWIQGEASDTPNYSICAGLTNIDRSMMPNLSGSLSNGSPGWTGVG